MILETLSILIKTNADQASGKLDDLSESSKKAGESTDRTTQFINKSSEGFKTLGGEVVGVIKQFGALMLGATALTGAIAKLTSEENKIQALQNLATGTGQSVEELQKLSGELTAITGSSGGLTAFAEMGKKLAGLKFGMNSEMLQPLARLGVSAYDASGHVKSLSTLILDLNKATEHMSGADAAVLLSNIGLSPEQIALVRTSREQLTRMQPVMEKLGQASKINAEELKKLTPELGMLKAKSETMWLNIANKLIPIFTDFIGWLSKVSDAVGSLTEVYKEHSAFFNTIIAGIAGLIIAVYIPAIMSAVVATGLFLLSWLPFIAIAALVIGAIALIVDDFEAFRHGQKSVIGSVIKEWEKFKDFLFGIFEKVGAKWHHLVEGIMKRVHQLKNFFSFGSDKDAEQKEKSTTSTGGYRGTDYDVPEASPAAMGYKETTVETNAKPEPLFKKSTDQIKSAVERSNARNEKITRNIVNINNNYSNNALNTAKPEVVANKTNLTNNKGGDTTHNNTFNINAPINGTNLTPDSIHQVFGDKFKTLINNVGVHLSDGVAN